MNAILLDTAPAGADQGASVPYSPRIDGLLMPDDQALAAWKDRQRDEAIAAFLAEEHQQTLKKIDDALAFFRGEQH